MGLVPSSSGILTKTVVLSLKSMAETQKRSNQEHEMLILNSQASEVEDFTSGCNKNLTKIICTIVMITSRYAARPLEYNIRISPHFSISFPPDKSQRHHSDKN